MQLEREAAAYHACLQQACIWWFRAKPSALCLLLRGLFVQKPPVRYLVYTIRLQV